MLHMAIKNLFFTRPLYIDSEMTSRRYFYCTEAEAIEFHVESMGQNVNLYWFWDQKSRTMIRGWPLLFSRWRGQGYRAKYYTKLCLWVL